MTRSVELTPAEAPASSLKRLAVSGGAWAISGEVASQGLRFAGNLVLTRLLFPEHFGLMAIVTSVIQGLQMFSDTGLVGSVIKSARGAEPDFVNTAWTMQVIRGALLWVATVLIAFPAAVFYRDAQLLDLIPIAGLASVISGFQSTSVLLLKRRVSVKPLIVRDVASRVIGMVVTMALAWHFRSVWALVGGSLVRTCVMLALSYVLLEGPRPRFCLDRAVVGEIFQFGRWIFLSTAITFLIRHGDKLVLGRMISKEQLGVYAIAIMLAQAAQQAILTLHQTVVFPVYARVVNTDQSALRGIVYRTRRGLLFLFLPPVLVLSLFGRPIIELLYASPYHGAGGLLQVLAAGVIPGIVNVTVGGVLLAVGDSFRHMLVQIVRGVALVLGMLIGGSMAGMEGFVVGIAVARFVDYPVVAWAVHKYGVWLPSLDIPALALGAAALAIAITS